MAILLIGFSKAGEVFKPIPQSVHYDRDKAELGKLLFHDPILSKDGTVSCASCHDLYRKCGTDQRPFSIGVEGKKGNANAPTVFNAVFNFRLFWNGRAKDLKEQAISPIQNPVEMGMSPEEVERRLNKNPFYKKKFKEIYKSNYIKFDQVIDAIAEFEKALITPNSKFDKFLRGEIKLSKKEIEGFELFKKLGCVTCHNGINIGGNSFQKLGTVIPYPWKTSYPDRYQITKRESDKNVFRVPSLRNVDCTYPYFHDGSIKTLKKAVKLMGKYNLGIDLSDEDIDKIVSFLKTLRGEIPPILREDNQH